MTKSFHLDASRLTAFLETLRQLVDDGIVAPAAARLIADHIGANAHEFVELNLA